MLKKQVQVGGLYRAKVAGNLTTVRVDAIHEVTGYKTTGTYSGRRTVPARTSYAVTNLRTGRTTTFHSAAKFRTVAANQTPN